MSNCDPLIDQIKQLQPNEIGELFHQFVKDDNLKSIETLILSEMIDINTTNRNQEPALYNAIINQQWKMVQLLIQHKALLTHPDWSSTSKHVVGYVLHYAIRDHDVDESFIDFLLLRQSQQHPKIHIEQKDENGYTPILTAALYGNLRILIHLYNNYNPDIRAISLNGHNLFHCAILSKENCTIELLDTISLLGVDINTIDKGNNDFQQQATPLTYAIYNELGFDIIKHLVELDADIITTNDLRYNPNGDEFLHDDVQSHLFKAIELQDDHDHQIFNYLVESSTSPNISFKALLQKAFENNNFDVVKLIIEKHRIKFDQDSRQIDLFLTMFGLYDSIEGLFEPDEFPIRLKMIEYLLGQNLQGCFDFNVVRTNFSDDTTAFLIISQYPQSTLQLLQLMVQNGSNIHAIDEYGFGVLKLLCDIENDTTAEDIITKLDYFIGLGVDVNLNVDRENATVQSPLHCAVSNEAFAPILVPHLIHHHNADITSLDHYGSLPLHFVLHPELVLLLLTPESITHQNNNKDTPLSLAIYNPSSFPSPQHYFQVVSNLLHFGANINIPNNDGVCPIHIIFNCILFQNQPIDVIELLIQQPNINLNVVDVNNLTPLQLAIDRFVDPNDTNDDDDDDDEDVRHATSDEIRLKAIQSIKLLLQYNADITVRNSDYNGVDTILRDITHPDFYTGYFNQINTDLVEELMEVIMDGIIDRLLIEYTSKLN